MTETALQAANETGSAMPSGGAPGEAPHDGPDIDPHRLDPDAVRVLLRLRQNNHEGYLVGGCVRDLLIGRTPKDFDIATSATPEELRALFRNCRLIGRRFRLAHVYFRGGKVLEVATFRAMPHEDEEPHDAGETGDGDEGDEGEAGAEGPERVVDCDGESPERVSGDDGEAPEGAGVELQAASTAPEAQPDLLITEDNTFGTAEQDARRRDFTINGLFYEPMAGRVIDHVNGLRDLAGREIRTIGDPEVRLREDPVRILRAVRFAAKLGFDIEPRTYAAMEGVVEDLPRCAPPRLLEETFRLLRGGVSAPAVRLIEALGALPVLMPPVAAYLAEGDVERAKEYWRFLEAMDAQVQSGVEFDDSMLLACVLLPIALAEPEVAEGESEGRRPPSVAQAIEALLSELVQKARLPRRIAERARMILMAQRTLAGLRRRRGGLGSFRGHPLFRESLAVFEVWVTATGLHQEALAQWKSGGAPKPASSAEGPRRRRRGRRSGAEGAGDGEAAVDVAPAEAAEAPAPAAAE